MKKWSVVGGTVIAASALALAGCSGGGGGGSSSGADNTVKYLVTQPDTPEQLTAIKADIANFEKKSGVKVQLTVLPGDTLKTALQTQLQSGNGPDVFGCDTGVGYAGTLQKAGYLYDLTDEYKKKNYPVFDWAKKSVTFDGKIWGIPDQVEQIGLFYNKDIFEENGLEAPQNLADLDNIAATLKAKKIIPITLSDKEGWESYHLMGMTLPSQIGVDAEQELLDGTTSWDSPDVANVFNIWKQFAAKGWTPPSPASIEYANANALFYSGKAAIDPTGTWLLSDIAANTKFNVAFIPFPGPDDSGVAVTGLGAGTCMSAKAKNVPATLKLMDYLVSPEHGKWELTQTTIPAYPVSTDGVELTPLFKQIVTDTADYAKKDGEVGKYIDTNSTDVFNKALSDSMQGVLAGSISPEQAAKNLQTAAASSKK